MSGAFTHEACLYDGERGLLDLVVPFARDGARLGEPVVFVVHEAHAVPLRAALGDLAGVTFLPFAYARPARAIKALLRLFEQHAADGNGRMRIVGEVHHPAVASWEPWARYEAAVNSLYAGFDVSALCLYDTRSTPASVLADVACTHPWVMTAGHSHQISDGYESPELFLSERRSPPIDPLERTPVALELIDASPAVARHAIAQLASRHTRLTGEQTDDIVCSVSEALTNAHLYGRAPITLRVWAADERLHATVTDTGPGLSDPFAGLRPGPASASHSGLGLWIAHQLCSQVTHAHDRDGFTIRLTVGAS